MRNLLRLILIFSLFLIGSTFDLSQAATPEEALFLRGKTLLDKLQFHQCIPYFDEALKLNPNDWNCRYYRAKALIAMDDTTHALEDLNAISKSSAPSASAYDLRAQIYFAQGKFDSAMNDVNSALSLTTDKLERAARLNTRAKFYRSHKQFDKALADLNASLSLNPNLVPDYIDRGYVYDQLNEPYKAIADFSKAIDLVGKSGNGMNRLLSNRMKVYEKIGRRDLAKKDSDALSSDVKDMFDPFLSGRSHM